MTKFSLLCFALSFLFAPLQAQYDDLMKKTDISWVAEYTTEFTLDPLNEQTFYYEIEYETANELNVMQLSDTPKNNGLFKDTNLDRFFSKQMFDAIREGIFRIYEDEQLETLIPKEKIQEYLIRNDTVAGPDPVSYDEPDFVVVRNELSPDDVKSFKVRQVFFYNKSEKTFGSRILAVAPVIYGYDLEGMASVKTLFWVKIDLPKNASKITPSEVTYAFETKMKGNAPKAQDFIIKKGRMDFLMLIVNEVASPSHLILDEKFEPIDPAKLQSFVLTTDTITTRDPETWAEQTEIFQRNVIKDVHQIGFVQHWFYDDRKNLLANRVVAVAPLLMVTDPENNFLYKRPLFYMMNE